MPGYTSQARQDAYDYLRLIRQLRMITADQYKHEKAKIDRREAKSVADAEAKRVAKEAEAKAKRDAKKAETAERNRLKAEAEAKRKELEKKKKEEARNMTRVSADLLRHKYTADNDEEVAIREMWKLALNTRSRFIGGDVDVTLDVKPGGRSYKAFRFHFVYESNRYKFAGGDVFLILQPTPIQAKYLKQRFRDGITHCVFVPMIDKLKRLLETSSDSTKSRLNRRIKKLNALHAIYEEAVPEDKMEEVVKASGLKFTLCDIFKNEIAVYNKNGRVGSLFGSNVRENHIDIGVMV